MPQFLISTTHFVIAWWFYMAQYGIWYKRVYVTVHTVGMVTIKRDHSDGGVVIGARQVGPSISQRPDVVGF